MCECITNLKLVNNYKNKHFDDEIVIFSTYVRFGSTPDGTPLYYTNCERLKVATRRYQSNKKRGQKKFF